jgi:hypothetical protein
MARSITLILGGGLSSDLGPNFNLTADIGSVTPSTGTKTELLAGKIVSVDDAATLVTITSTGLCTNSITQSIPCVSTTTTTTTAYPPTSGQSYYKVAVSRDDVNTSNDGKYVLIGKTGTNILKISDNYGTGFRNVTMAFASGGSCASVGVSGTGQYMYVVETNTSAGKWIWRSQDYGVTWFKVPTFTSPRAWSSISVSRTGQYVMATATNVDEVYPGNDSAYWFQTSQYWLSTTYGATFTRTNNAPDGSKYFIYGSAISSNGQTQLLVSPNSSTDFDGAAYVSTNSGATFTTKLVDGSVNNFDCAMSSNGAVQVIARSYGYFDAPALLNNTLLVKSSDSGATWTTFGVTQKKWTNVAMDGTGNNLIVTTYDPGYIYRSTNLGTVTAVTGPGSRAWGDVAMSYTGYAYATEQTGIWRSIDSGASWTKLT